MILDSLVVFQHHVIKELCNLWVGDILFLVVEERDSTCSRLNQTLLFISV